MVLHELPKAQTWKTTQAAKRICLAGAMSRATPLAKPKLAAKTAKWPGSPPEQLEMMEAAASFCLRQIYVCSLSSTNTDLRCLEKNLYFSRVLHFIHASTFISKWWLEINFAANQTKVYPVNACYGFQHATSPASSSANSALGGAAARGLSWSVLIQALKMSWPSHRP